ncbi:GldG family protein [Kaarinaea lacus]
MLVSEKSQRQLRLQNIIFLVLLLGIAGLLAWLSARYSFEADLTASGKNTLSEASVALLDKLDKPVSITSFATEDDTLRRSVHDLVARYQRHKADINFHFVNPDIEPEKVRQLGLSVNGELVIEYQGQQETLNNISEMGITNTLQRLARSGERWLLFLEGHGERKAHGQANHDLANWVKQLESKGFKAQGHTLATSPRIPDNTRVLVIASPQVDLLDGEVNLIKQYINEGGNLLWLTDPGDQHGMSAIAELLGITFNPGMIVDPTTQILGLRDPRFALVATYPGDAISGKLETLTLYPQAVSLKLTPPSGWTGQDILLTESRSWSETGKVAGSIRFDANEDIQGPLTVGVALTRARPDSTDKEKSQEQQAGEQRIVVVGDGDFLSNAYLGNGANLTLGMNIVNWLAHDDSFIEIPLKMTVDRQLQLSPLAQGMIGIGFLFVLPLALAGSGFVIWWRRRKR